jgi:hypothetical protein
MSMSQTTGEYSALDYLLEKTRIMHDPKLNNDKILGTIEDIAKIIKLVQLHTSKSS